MLTIWLTVHAIQNISCSLFFRRTGHLYPGVCAFRGSQCREFLWLHEFTWVCCWPTAWALLLSVAPTSPVCVVRPLWPKQLCTQLSLCSLLALPVFSLASGLLLLLQTCLVLASPSFSMLSLSWGCSAVTRFSFTTLIHIFCLRVSQLRG